ncbi:transcriptional regulator, LacI family [Paenibacillus sp. UNCCL117]|uniref:LacI family DNA-binding transcriptional regulator n=1 Tax=unclassified Paenibacillus TaxID=185978 RepID=UPI0008889687|nr:MULTISPECIES: LacI family DNA-binding transcriptional regulator [unclassified Paenibacillus]SDD57778.1 transcriptional regulator, LacI family [Paenibacillus sp. cl123]SFW51125.1 transcriptional regulator, LacI family [Paenibacillus sp. UNCCL117]
MGSITIKDVAAAAGVSTATVSRVMNRNGYVSETVRMQVERVMAELNYQPNALARSLKQERTRTVGMILPDMTNPYFMSVSRQAQQRLLERGYHLIYMDSAEDSQKELEAIRLLQGMRIEALILAGTGHNGELLQLLMQSGLTVILLDRIIPGVHADQVVEDNVSAAEEGAAYLLGKYGERIGIIGGPSTISTAGERLRGVRNAYERSGRSLAEEWVYTGDYSRASGMRACDYFMSMQQPPEAIFSANNEMTYGFYCGLRERGLRLDALEVVSFGQLDAAALFANKLSVIVQQPEQIGEALTEIIFKRLEQDATGREKRLFVPRFEKFS